MTTNEHTEKFNANLRASLEETYKALMELQESQEFWIKNHEEIVNNSLPGTQTYKDSKRSLKFLKPQMAQTIIERNMLHSLLVDAHRKTAAE